jgi:trehalose/maltose hydrolase-like predicted phosphorylase
VDETRCALCSRVNDDEWLLGYEGIEPSEEGTREALLTLGNGYMATRGAAPEARADGVHYPATYVAGVYNRLVSHVDGREREDESLVNLPNWLPLTFRPRNGQWFEPATSELVHHHVALDIRRGLLLRELVVRDGQDRRTHVTQERLVSMSRPHLAALRTVITPGNWSGRVEIRSLVDGRVENDNVAEFAALAKQHLGSPSTGHDADSVWLVTETTQSRIRVAVALSTTLPRREQLVTADCRVVDGSGFVGHELTVDAEAGDPIIIDKVVAIYASRDRAIAGPLDAAHNEIIDAPGFAVLRDDHVLEWSQQWQRLRLAFDGDGPMRDRRAMNLHLFHLAQSLSRHSADLDVGVGARGLHGEAYRGHVFWDELFVFPLLNFRIPELTRALLLYRYRRLPQARRLAQEIGVSGARFPWQSGSNGREETPEWFYNPRSKRWMDDNSRRQYHVNLAVAYNVWQYFQVTADVDFLRAYGAELIVEIARFWAGIARYDPDSDRYHIRGVMGPDEFHDGYPGKPGRGLDDNAYVNVMTAWTLARARDTYDVLGGHHTGDLWERLGLTGAELDEWDRISRRLSVPFLANGLPSQFEGYDDLDELDWDAYRNRYANIGRLDLILESEGDTTNRYKASKQADVLMLFYLLSAEELTEIVRRLGYDYDPATIPATVDYYLARTTHGSTLSNVVHAWVLARTNRRASWYLLQDALEADLSDTQGGTTREGIHLGAMAGTADILQRCYSGLESRDDALWLNPLLPDALTLLEFDLHYRGHWLKCHLHADRFVIDALPSAASPVTIVIDEQRHELDGGARLEVRRPSPGRASR